MSNQEINEQLSAWILNEEFTPDRERIDSLRNQFTELIEEEKKKQLESFIEEGGEEADFSYDKSAVEYAFDDLLKQYHDKRKAFEKSKNDALEINYKEKRILIEELQALIQDEENISKAYLRFNAIKEKWNLIGPATPDKRRQLQADYSRLIELFYYNINIYRELKINDLKKNQELKLEVIEKITNLKNEKAINQVDFLIHQYLDEWDQIGPTFREEWEKTRDIFKEGVNAAFERIRLHRKSVKEEHDGHYASKKALVEKAKEIASRELDEMKVVQISTKEIIDLQKEWKQIGNAGRGKNDKIWKEFRKQCDAYFSLRATFLESSNKEFAQFKEKKKALIQKAKELHKGENATEIANKLKGLQREWKEVGKLLPQEEYRLFREFRGYCDAFFERKKVEAKELESELKANLKKKEELLLSFTANLEQGAKEKGEDLIEEWKLEWAKIGHVHERMAEKVEQTFNNLVVKAYKAMGISKSQIIEKEFNNKLDMLTSNDDAEAGLQAERRNIQAQIREAESAARQLEDKMAFFKYSDDTNPLKKDLMDRIAAAQGQIDEIREKRKRVDLMIKEIKKAKEKDAEEINVGDEKESDS